MRIRMDRRGRVVIPKPLRDEVGLAEGDEVDVSVWEGRIEIEPVPKARLVEREGRLVIEADREMPPVTNEDVRALIEQIRDERAERCLRPPDS